MDSFEYYRDYKQELGERLRVPRDLGHLPDQGLDYIIEDDFELVTYLVAGPNESISLLNHRWRFRERRIVFVEAHRTKQDFERCRICRALGRKWMFTPDIVLLKANW